ncbi:MAG: DUF1275 domain-containing protein [Defluviitaleaceae bacterium]|nr:DUF1275 domain-containing protein [Defluviitaleaceae bacterium]
MIIAPETDKNATRKVAFLTLATIFIMGYINALALNTIDVTAMITAQSGNIVWLGIDFTQAIMGQQIYQFGYGYVDVEGFEAWIPFIQRVALFLGFAAGSAIGWSTKDIFKENKRIQFYYDWTLFAAPIVAYPILFQYNIPPAISLLLLGFSAGATLRFFRKLYHLDINTSMATGSAMFVGIHFVEYIKTKSKKELFTVCLFLIAVFTFSFGAGIYQMLNNLQPAVSTPSVQIISWTNIALIVFCVIPYFFYPKPNSKVA